MNKQRITASLLAMVMAASQVTPAMAAEDTSTHWAKNALTEWQGYGIIQGDQDGNLNPDHPITRAEMATILDRVMDYQVKAGNHYTDLDNSWYTDAILGASAAGMITGYTDGTVKPNAPISRQEAVVMIARVLALDTANAPANSYADANEIESWAVPAVNAMTAAGYIQGSGNLFRPLDTITRAEAITMFDNIFTTLLNKAGTYTENVAGSAVINCDNMVLQDMTVAGDLIVAEGVGAGHVVLENVTVEGRLIVRGGGENSIIIKGNSKIGEMQVARQKGKVRVSVEGNAQVRTIRVTAGADAVKVEGTVDTVAIEGAGVAVEITGTVKNVTVADTAVSAALTVAKGAKVETVTTAAANTAITGEGTVSKVEAAEGSTGTKVETEGTQVENNGSGDVTTGDGETVKPGDTGSTGGGSTGGGTSDTTAPTASAFTVTVGGQSYQDGAAVVTKESSAELSAIAITMSEAVSPVAGAELKVMAQQGEGAAEQIGTFAVGEDKKNLTVTLTDGTKVLSAGTWKLYIPAETLQDTAGNKAAEMALTLTVEQDNVAPVAETFTIGTAEYPVTVETQTIHVPIGEAMEALTLQMNEKVFAVDESCTVPVYVSAEDGSGEDVFGTITIGADGAQALQVAYADNHKTYVEGAWKIYIKENAIRDAVGNTNETLSVTLTFMDNENVTVSDASQLHNAIQAGVSEITLGSPVTLTEDLDIPETVTVILGANDLTVGTNATLTVAGTLTADSGVVTGENGARLVATKKLAMATGVTAADTYVWDTDTWRSVVDTVAELNAALIAAESVGGTVNLEADLSVTAEETVTIPSGVTLNLGEYAVENAGTILNQGGTIQGTAITGTGKVILETAALEDTWNPVYTQCNLTTSDSVDGAFEVPATGTLNLASGVVLTIHDGAVLTVSGTVSGDGEIVGAGTNATLKVVGTVTGGTGTLEAGIYKWDTDTSAWTKTVNTIEDLQTALNAGGTIFLGGEVTFDTTDQALYVPDTATLVISDGAKLTILGAGLQIAGTVDVQSGGTLALVKKQIGQDNYDHSSVTIDYSGNLNIVPGGMLDDSKNDGVGGLIIMHVNSFERLQLATSEAYNFVQNIYIYDATHDGVDELEVTETVQLQVGQRLFLYDDVKVTCTNGAEIQPAEGDMSSYLVCDAFWNNTYYAELATALTEAEAGSAPKTVQTVYYISATEPVAIPAGVTLEIPSGKTVAVSGSGSLTIQAGATLEVNGTLQGIVSAEETAVLTVGTEATISDMPELEPGKAYIYTNSQWTLEEKSEREKLQELLNAAKNSPDQKTVTLTDSVTLERPEQGAADYWYDLMIPKGVTLVIPAGKSFVLDGIGATLSGTLQVQQGGTLELKHKSTAAYLGIDVDGVLEVVEGGTVTVGTGCTIMKDVTSLEKLLEAFADPYILYVALKDNLTVEGTVQWDLNGKSITTGGEYKLTVDTGAVLTLTGSAYDEVHPASSDLSWIGCGIVNNGTIAIGADGTPADISMGQINGKPEDYSGTGTVTIASGSSLYINGVVGFPTIVGTDGTSKVTMSSYGICEAVTGSPDAGDKSAYIWNTDKWEKEST